jgi:hypothetical protein
MIPVQGCIYVSIVHNGSNSGRPSRLPGIRLTPHKLKTHRHDVETQQYVERLGPGNVSAFGNGMNDRKFLKAMKKAAGLAAAVDNGDGC